MEGHIKLDQKMVSLLVYHFVKGHFDLLKDVPVFIYFVKIIPLSHALLLFLGFGNKRTKPVVYFYLR